MPLFFFAMPGFYILAVYILAAVLPAVFLMRYIYRQDQIEPEPPGLLIGLIFSGVAAALCPIFFGSCPKKTGRARSKRKTLLAFVHKG